MSPPPHAARSKTRTTSDVSLLDRDSTIPSRAQLLNTADGSMASPSAVCLNLRMSGFPLNFGVDLSCIFS